MKSVYLCTSRASVIGSIAVLSSVALAQDRPVPEVKSLCQSVIASIMVGKVSCTAALCNTGAAEGGFTGFLSKMTNRGAIDGPSFSIGVGAQLSTALKQTGCFSVSDAASLEENRKEMEALGRSVPPPPQVDYFVRSSITKAEYVLDESGFLGFKTVIAKSSLTLDTKLVSASTGAVSEAGSYDSTVERKSSGVDLGIYKSNDDAAKRGTPFSDVSRDVIVKAAMGLATRILSQPGSTKPSIASTAVPQQAPTAPAAAASAP